MPAKAMVPVETFPSIHLASEPLGFGGTRQCAGTVVCPPSSTALAAMGRSYNTFASIAVGG